MVRARPYNKNQIAGTKPLGLIWHIANLVQKRREAMGKVSVTPPYTLLLALGQNVQVSPGLVEHLLL